jgi:hypothetical protein
MVGPMQVGSFLGLGQDVNGAATTVPHGGGDGGGGGVLKILIEIGEQSHEASALR